MTSAPSMPRLFQSTPPARGATCRVDEEKPVMSISIHAPREGGDVCSLIVPGDVTGISIHAPREGGDGKQKGKVVDVKISIHAHREGGDSTSLPSEFFTVRFQSTPPARGATTLSPSPSGSPPDFNPRPPRGGRLPGGALIVDVVRFHSTPPARGATAKMHSFTRGSLTNK